MWKFYVCASLLFALLSIQVTLVSADPATGIATIDTQWTWAVCGSQPSTQASFIAEMVTDEEDTSDFGTKFKQPEIDNAGTEGTGFVAALLNYENLSAYREVDEGESLTITPVHACYQEPVTTCGYNDSAPLDEAVWCLMVYNPTDEPVQFRATFDLCVDCDSASGDIPVPKSQDEPVDGEADPSSNGATPEDPNANGGGTSSDLKDPSNGSEDNDSFENPFPNAAAYVTFGNFPLAASLAFVFCVLCLSA